MRAFNQLTKFLDSLFSFTLYNRNAVKEKK